MLAQFSVIALDILLLATLVYLFVLMRKLKVLSSHRDDMRTIISDVIVATESSRDAVARLKSSVIESQNSMVKYFEDARQIQSEFEARIADANKVLADIEALRGKSAMMNHETFAKKETISDRKSNNEKQDATETYRQSLPRHSRTESDRPLIGYPVEDEDIDIQRRLASIHESVNHLRSKLMANA